MTETLIPPADVAIVGAGTMGQGIALLAALSGFGVRLHDPSDAALDSARATIAKHLERGVEKARWTADAAEAALSNLRTPADLLGAVADADIVIEAVPESISLKRAVFAELSSIVPDSAVLATNTSSLSVTEIAAAATEPARVIGLHFFNPPVHMKLLEIIRAEQTSDETVARCQSFGDALGREMIVVQDTPGFATSRLGLVIGLEAIRMLEEGVASAEDIDRAMALGYRHPMGPLRLTDLVGLDVRLAIADHLCGELGERFRPPPLLRRMVRAGKLGQKTGQGFYCWET